MDPSILSLAPFADGIGFGEAPRWHRGELWLSDIVERQVLCVSADGHVHKVLDTPGEPSGLGWLPDDTLLVVQMQEHEVWAHAHGKLRRYSGTAPMTRIRLNDMVVDRNGRAWVSSFGFDYERGEAVQSTNLVCIDPGGHAWIAADNVWCPNGMAIDDTGEILFVGQSASPELLEFDIGANGVLKNRRVFGTLPPTPSRTASASTARRRCGLPRRPRASSCAWNAAAPSRTACRRASASRLPACWAGRGAARSTVSPRRR